MYVTFPFTSGDALLTDFVTPRLAVRASTATLLVLFELVGSNCDDPVMVAVFVTGLAVVTCAVICSAWGFSPSGVSFRSTPL